MRRAFKENQRAEKLFKSEARAVMRRDKRSHKKEIHEGRGLNRGVVDAVACEATGGGSAVAEASQQSTDNFIKIGMEGDSDRDSDSDSDSDSTDTSLSDTCSEVDGSNSDYEDVYNYEEGSPEMIDADEEMGFCNADTDGIHVDYLPRAKKIRFTEEGNHKVQLAWDATILH